MATLCLAAPAGAAQDDPLTITPSEVYAGESFTVAGGDCTGVAMIGVVAPQGEGAVAVESAEADDSGAWSSTITIPEDTPAGVYDVDAFCEGSYDGYNGYNGAMGRAGAVESFDYALGSITVLADEVVTTTTVTPVPQAEGTGETGTLPQTGMNVLALLVAGATLAIGGRLVSDWSKRRQSA